MANDRYANGPDSSPMAGEEPFALREWFVWRRLRWHLAALALAIVLLGYIGPFGTYLRMPAGERLAYWALAMAGNWLLALACIFAVLNRLSARLPALVCVLTGGLAAAVPGTLLIAAIEWLFAGAVPASLATGELFLATGLLHLALGPVVWRTIELPLLGGAGTPLSAPAAAGDDTAPPPPLLDRLPAGRRGRLLHLRMRDHYVEIHTDRGSDLVLMRFGDALKELGGIEGMQVHRSHWIARAAVARIVRRGGRTVVRLANGTEVPVSRRHAAALREAGWT